MDGKLNKKRAESSRGESSWYW